MVTACFNLKYLANARLFINHGPGHRSAVSRPPRSLSLSSSICPPRLDYLAGFHIHRSLLLPQLITCHHTEAKAIVPVLSRTDTDTYFPLKPPLPPPTCPQTPLVLGTRLAYHRGHCNSIFAFSSPLPVPPLPSSQGNFCILQVQYFFPSSRSRLSPTRLFSMVILSYQFLLSPSLIL